MAAYSLYEMHLAKLVSHVSQLAELPENWDGYGGASPSKTTASHILALLKALPAPLVVPLETEAIDPNPNGTISILWRTETGDFSLEIGTKRAACYLKMGGQIVHVDDFMKPEEAGFSSEIQFQLARLYPELQEKTPAKSPVASLFNRTNGTPEPIKQKRKTVSPL